jgi:hypothetical protein
MQLKILTLDMILLERLTRQLMNSSCDLYRPRSSLNLIRRHAFRKTRAIVWIPIRSYNPYTPGIPNQALTCGTPLGRK